ncbi:glycerol-3-phosphate dehydrogenase/oxidase [bacterium]|nr:glycerol-3-phosphate dehydrogenase/oxidase [bacterium]
MVDEKTDHFDVVIVGCGINGAGVFRDLCAQGLKCLVVDKGDFGSGTSAAPSRLIHGGLKYLETGELRLVAESTYERNLLLKNAPHLVAPLPTAIPVLSWTRGVLAAVRTLFGSTTAPRSRGALLVKLGLAMYDFYGSRQRQMPRHRMVYKKQALLQIPALTPQIVALGTYYDALVNAPERLVLELVTDGLRLSGGSEAFNGCDVTGHTKDSLILALPDGGTRHVQTSLVVNAAGPWIDQVNKRFGIEGRLIGGTRGSHVLLNHSALLEQLNGRMLYFEADDGRILLVFPYQGRALVGSTDIPAEDPDTVHCTEQETSYFLDSLRTLLPGLKFNERQIVYAYSGIRPLPFSDGIAPGLISRDHSAPQVAPTDTRLFSVISLVGGKWTTFRAFSEEVSNSVLKTLDKTRTCTTEELPIGGGRGMPMDEDSRQRWIDATAAATGATSERVGILLERYGTTAQAIAEHEGADSTLLADAPDFSDAEIDWLARHERVLHLSDLLLRRTPLAIRGGLTPTLCQRTAEIAANALDWDSERKQVELKNLETLLANKHGVVLKLC